jgi:O-antigen/teichoic acid export membrane protein
VKTAPDTALKNAALGSTLRAVHFCVSILVALLLTPFVVHSLGDRMYGFWLFVGAFAGYYSLFDLGLATAVSRHLAGALGSGDRRECARIFSAALQIYPLFGMLALLATGAAGVLSPHLATDPRQAELFLEVILILGAGAILALVLQPYVGVLQALGRFDLIAGLDVVTLILRAVLIVGALSAGYGVFALAWITCLSSLPRLAVSIYLSRRLLPWLRYERQPASSATTKTLFGYSFYMLIARVADTLRSNTDSLVITAFVGLAAVTPYGIAASLAQKFRDLMTALLGVLQPVYSRLDGEGDRDRIKRTLFFATKISMCVSTFVGFALIAWGSLFIDRWMGPGYGSAYPCLAVLAIGWTIQCWQSPSVSLMYATSRHRSYAFTNMLEAVSNLLLSVWWVKSFGILGVALGTTVPMIVVRLFLQPYYTCKMIEIGLREYAGVFLANVGRTLAALTVPFAIAVAFRPAGFVQLGMSAAAAAAAYGILTWLLLFTPEEKTRLMSLRPTR